MTCTPQLLTDYALPKDPPNLLRRSVSRTLRNAFLATNVRVAVNGEWMPASSATRALGNPVQVITAWNPFGNEQPIELNRVANQHLRHALESQGWDVHPALGGPEACQGLRTRLRAGSLVKECRSAPIPGFRAVWGHPATPRGSATGLHLGPRGVQDARLLEHQGADLVKT